MNYKRVIIFVLLFIKIQHILLLFECNYYLDMVSDIQGYKFNFFKNDKNQLSLKNILIYTLGYIPFPIFLYYYIIREHKSIKEGFLFTTALNALWDCGLFSLFDKAVKHVSALLYDTIIVGGVGMVIAQYIFYNYYNIIKKHIPLLSILYLITMLMCGYTCYKYNPDLSNIKGVVLF